MFAKISERVVNHLICKSIIKYDDHDIYQYGLNRFFTICLNIITILILGIIFNLVLQGIIFAFSFMALRTYTGGYHSKTPVRCYITTSISIIITLAVIKFIPINRFICLGLLIFSCLLIMLLSPIGCSNKPLDEIEIVVYKRRAVIICIAEASVALILLALNFSLIYLPIVFAHTLIGIALILGIKQNQIVYSYNKKKHN